MTDEEAMAITSHSAENSQRKPPTRIEKLGTLYDAAIERIRDRDAMGYSKNDVKTATANQRRHECDMQVIQTYLEQTARPKEAAMDVQGMIEALDELNGNLETVMAMDGATMNGLEIHSNGKLYGFEDGYFVEIAEH